MDKPIWMDEDVYEKSGFSGWYSFLIKIFLVILLMGVFFFVLDFLGWDTGFLKEISRFSMELIVLSTIILVAMILLPKLLASDEETNQMKKNSSQKKKLRILRFPEKNLLMK